ncbi:4-demethylwyosine synthase TYW1 [Thermoproteota archaeon]
MSLDSHNLLKKQGYHWVGKHSAAKKCKWLHESLVHNRVCYKEKFYGIKSHRCLQMSPSVLNCLTYCIHCWRALPEDIGLSRESVFHGDWDDATVIAEGLLNEHKRILSGYKSQVINGIIDERKYEEALNPTQLAMSLSGEPTLYPKLNELIQIFKNRGCSVFLVTSGVLPKALESLMNTNSEPTRLYISLSSPNQNSYLKLNRPSRKNLWFSLLKSLDILEEFRCSTVARITAINGLNMDHNDVNGFADLIQRSKCSEIEIKGYMHVGFSTKRLSEQNMPSFQDIKEFSEKLGDLTGYKVINEMVQSRVVLLSK